MATGTNIAGKTTRATAHYINARDNIKQALADGRWPNFGKKPHTAKSTPQEPLFCVGVTLANAGPMDKRLTGGGGLGGRKGG